MSSSREQILKTLRGTTMPSGPRLKPPALPAVMTSASDAATPLAQRVQIFAAVLDKLGAPVELVANMAEAGQRVAAILMQHEATSLALSDAPEALAIAATLPSSIERCHHDAERDVLMRSHAGLSGVQWAIAETGTLALVSRHERHRLATLLPDLHIALVPASRLLATLGDAFDRLEAAGVPDAATITFVTGPSRTADIELELVVGVHGPKALHVLVIADA